MIDSADRVAIALLAELTSGKHTAEEAQALTVKHIAYAMLTAREDEASHCGADVFMEAQIADGLDAIDRRISMHRKQLRRLKPRRTRK